jgi:hypothetical protein
MGRNAPGKSQAFAAKIRAAAAMKYFHFSPELPGI